MVSFLTPYWSGAEMMRIHLRSLRRFHPDAPILVSKRGGGRPEMEQYRREFGIRYWMEDCGYTNAYLRLLQRCRTRYVCILDHDTVLLANLNPLLDELREGKSGLVGIEERVRLPQTIEAAWPGSNGWLRFSPGNTAANFLMFDWTAFKQPWGLRGVFGRPTPGSRHFDFDYGIGQRLRDHLYLRPFHAPRYGIGNLLKHQDTPILWHQWYGSYRTRLAGDQAAERDLRAIAQRGEQAFIADYPELDFDGLSEAWGSTRDLATEQRVLAARPTTLEHVASPWRRSAASHLRSLFAQAVVGLERRR
jgi:hypothetical protein